MGQQKGNQYNKIVQICTMHIGNIIKQVIDDNNVNISALAESIGKQRSNLYNIFERKSVDTELLYMLSKKLKYDFFKHYSDELRSELGLVEEPKTEHHEAKKERRIMVEVSLSEKEYQDLIRKRVM